MIKILWQILKRALEWSSGIYTAILTFVPESMFSHCSWGVTDFLVAVNWLNFPDVQGCNIVITRIVGFLITFIALSVLSVIYSLFFKTIEIKSKSYSIVIEYGDLLTKNNCQRVINFDECFTTTVGTRPADIKKTSVCGQYLLQHPNLNTDDLIRQCGAKPSDDKSDYNNQTCYRPGTLVPNGDDLLMAFTKLDSNGRSKGFTVDSYLECLGLLWQEIDKYYNQKDICIPLLGTGIAKFDNGTSTSLSKEEALDLIISSYKLSPYKLKESSTLHIVCKRNKELFLDKISSSSCFEKENCRL